MVMGLDAPQLVVDGKTIPFVEPLKGYQLLWSVWPLLLVFVGGALGGMLGGVAAAINIKLLRTDIQGVLKYMLIGSISVFTIVVYLVLVTVVRSALS